MRYSWKEAAEALVSGVLVALPSDTVYGIAALATDETAAEKLFALKGRDANKAIVTVFSKREDLDAYLHFKLPPEVDAVLSEHWPGALTIVLPVQKDYVSEKVRAAGKTAGFRIPKHPELLSLIHTVGPLLLTSANPSGQVTAQSPDDVECYFGAEFPVVDGGILSQAASTVIGWDPESAWTLFRQGAIDVSSLCK